MLGYAIANPTIGLFDLLKIRNCKRLQYSKRKIDDAQLQQWNAAIGLRNRIVHEYMSVDIGIILALVEQRGYKFIVDFLREPFSLSP
jgi:uncharacterized protein YutE (UPF0331/DUF86 family)